MSKFLRPLFGLKFLLFFWIAMARQYRLVKNGASASYDSGKAHQARPTRGKRSGDVPIFIVAVIIWISLNILALVMNQA